MRQNTRQRSSVLQRVYINERGVENCSAFGGGHRDQSEEFAVDEAGH